MRKKCSSAKEPYSQQCPTSLPSCAYVGHYLTAGKRALIPKEFPPIRTARSTHRVHLFFSSILSPVSLSPSSSLSQSGFLGSHTPTCLPNLVRYSRLMLRRCRRDTQGRPRCGQAGTVVLRRPDSDKALTASLKEVMSTTPCPTGGVSSARARTSGDCP